MWGKKLGTKCFYVYHHLSLYTHTRPLIKNSAVVALPRCQSFASAGASESEEIG